MAAEAKAGGRRCGGHVRRPPPFRGGRAARTAAALLPPPGRGMAARLGRGLEAGAGAPRWRIPAALCPSGAAVFAEQTGGSLFVQKLSPESHPPAPAQRLLGGLQLWHGDPRDSPTAAATRASPPAFKERL